MPSIKVINLQTQTESEVITTTYGDAVSLDGAEVASVQCVLDVDTPSAKTFDSGAANVSDTTVVADTGVKEVTDVTCVADVAGSLNSTYFNYETKNAGGATVNLRYAWFNVNGAGVDPAPAGRTGISVALATDASDTDVASALRTALAADTKVTITGATTHCIITNVNCGNVTNAANGTASPGFSYSITPGVATNLNNTYMTFSQTANAVNYYAWFNINSEGTDPALAGKTGIEVTGAASITANNLATAARAAIDAAIGAEIAVTGATSHIILTNSTRGACAATANGAVTPGFTIVNSPAGADVEVSIDPDNYVTIPSHGLTTGLKGQLTTTGTLPAGLSLATDYFIIALTANTVQFATSLANAQAGTAVTITDTGADASVNTFTSTAIAGATVQMQESNDGSNWSNIGSSTNITADANIWLQVDNPGGLYARLAFTITAGRFSTVNTFVVKGPN